MEKWHAKLAAAFVLSLVSTLVCAQGLADAAAKEKARRKQVAPTSSGKVYTETDVSGHEAPPADPGSKSSDPATARSAPSAGSGHVTPSIRTTTGGDEATWRQLVTSARARISAAEADLQTIQRDANGKAATGAPPPRDCNVPDWVIRKGKEAIKAWSCTQDAAQPNQASRVEAARRAVDNAKQALAALEEQARRSGIPAGWLR